MTSGIFHSVSPDQIIVPPDRQRRNIDPKKVEKLANSIAQRGLIHPLLVTREHVLVSGATRLAAVKRLGWTAVSIQWQDEVDQAELDLIELEENIKRTDLPWPDHVLAVQKYHEARLRGDPGWSQEKTGEDLGYDQKTVSTYLMLAKGIRENPELEKEEFTVARGLVRAESQRLAKSAADSLGWPTSSVSYGCTPREYPSEPSTNGATTRPIGVADGILCADFLEWAPAYRGPTFNLIHCDFPYGIGSDSFGQGAQTLGHYEDTAEGYDELLNCLTDNFDRIAAPDCHVIFWFATGVKEKARSKTTNYCATFDFLTQRLGLTVDPPPLIWVKSDNVGIAPDPRRRPRRTYEWAFLGWRGDRPITRLKANTVCLPTTAEIHKHEKPVAVLRWFFEMIVDDTTAMLDPTAGSGSALRAAEALGARYVLGLEKSEDFCRRANRELAKSREDHSCGSQSQVDLAALGLI